MIGSGIVESRVLNELKPEQVTLWSFGNFFVTFGLPNIILVDVDEIFVGMLKNNFQETFLIPVHSVARYNHK